MTLTAQIIADLKSGKVVNLGPYYTPAEAKRILAEIRNECPDAWMMRSSSTNNWLVRPA